MSGIPAGAGSLLGKRLGKYDILALLALGGTAEIYLARIDGTNGFEKYVVVKCLHDHLADDPEFVKMFLDEARLAAVLDHSNIVQTFELGEHENRYYMVMEFLAGLSLAMVVRRAAERVSGGRMPVPLILNVAAQAAAGLHYSHERQQGGKPLNMVHRDISPQNLVIGFEGVVKVVDFGIARAEHRETKTKAGTIKGKFAYMSPEQCVAVNVDRRTDVFALGVIVHELLTGRRLFKRNSPYETYQAVIDCAVAPPSTVNVELDPALDAVIMKALAKDRDDRYPTAEAFGDAMLGYLHHRGKGSGPGEIGRWLEEHFQQEIEEHGERMRELISGREQPSLDLAWDENAPKKSETVPFKKKTADDEEEELSIGSSDVEVVRDSNVSLDQLVSRLGTEADDSRDDDDGPPPEKTRIEANPLELLEQLQKQATPVPVGTTTGGPAPLPAPPAAGEVAAKLPPPSAKYPVAEQIPTVIADDASSGQAAKPRTPPRGVVSEAAYKATVVHEVPVAAAAAARASDEPVTAVPRTPIRPSQKPMIASGPLGGAPENAPTAAAVPLDPAQVARIGAQSATHEAVRLTTDQMKQLENVTPVSRPPVTTGESPYPVMAGGRPYSTDIAPSKPIGAPIRPPVNNTASPFGDAAPAGKAGLANHDASPFGDAASAGKAGLANHAASPFGDAASARLANPSLPQSGQVVVNAGLMSPVGDAYPQQ
ncbi:MAG TPA: protein kinase, partial [Kofleriaceae bacterium]